MENRQRITLYDQMTSTSNTRSSLASLIQNDAVLSNQKNTNQTLLDIIRENEPNNVVVNVSVTDNNNNNSNNVVKDRKSWKAFKELLLFKRRNSEESTHQQQQNEDIPTNSDPSEFLPGGEFSDETAQVSMSLMDLLEESEIELERSSDVGDDGDDVEENNEKREEEEKEEEEREEEGEGSNVKVEHNCCVCMVRDKGAAFIPCGHTFCRMCSRELWVSRGNCPLCNHFILEVLDIF